MLDIQIRFCIFSEATRSIIVYWSEAWTWVHLPFSLVMKLSSWLLEPQGGYYSLNKLQIIRCKRAQKIEFHLLLRRGYLSASRSSRFPFYFFEASVKIIQKKNLETDQLNLINSIFDRDSWEPYSWVPMRF